MPIAKLSDAVKGRNPITALLYCAPGVGKSTALGIIANKTDGRTLLIDVDKTFVNAMSKMPDIDYDKIDIWPIDNIHTFDDWNTAMAEIEDMVYTGKAKYSNICVDNISELERCILSDLGSMGKNKGVPSMADYQYMQYMLVNSLRRMKSWKCNIFWTAWETVEQFQNPDGSGYSRILPKISAKIVDNICGLCDVVAKIHVNKDGARGLILEAMQNVYAKNQIDNRKLCKIEDFI